MSGFFYNADGRTYYTISALSPTGKSVRFLNIFSGEETEPKIIFAFMDACFDFEH